MLPGVAPAQGPVDPGMESLGAESFAKTFYDALLAGDAETLQSLAATARPEPGQQAWLKGWMETLRGGPEGGPESGPESGPEGGPESGPGSVGLRLESPSESLHYDATLPALQVGQEIRVLDESADALLAWAVDGREERVGLVRKDGVWRWLWPVEELRGVEIVEAFTARQSLLRRGAPLRGLPPLPLHMVAPLAPPSLVDHLRGCARLVFKIRADGSTDEIRFNGRPTSAYGKAARDALAQWRFAPTDEDREAFQSFAFEINTEGRWSAGYADGEGESESCRGLAWP
jgi:hypothetical protein